MTEFISGLNPNKRIGFIIGLILLALLSVFLIYFVYFSRTVSLYTGLSEADGEQVAAVLEANEIFHNLEQSANGIDVHVRSNDIDQVKLALAAKEMIFEEPQGLELFDNIDYGLTQFSQKVMLQRALQGELSRTISSINGVEFARIHLVLGEKSFFEDLSEPKAAVNLILERDSYITAEQIEGIQNLVAASVRGLSPENVIVSNSHGVVLSKGGSQEQNGENGKRDHRKFIESQLNSKVRTILEAVYGVGVANSEVSVELNYDKKQVETREYLSNGVGEQGLGFLKRERKSTKSSSDNSDEQSKDEEQENEFQYGNRVEKIEYSIGDIKRVTVSVLVPEDEKPERINSIRELVSAAVGFSEARGDIVVIKPVVPSEYKDGEEKPLVSANNEFNLDETDRSSRIGLYNNTPRAEEFSGTHQNRDIKASYFDLEIKEIFSEYGLFILISIGLLIVFLIVFGLIINKRLKGSTGRTMSDAERQQLLINIRRWLDEAEAKS